MTELAVSDKLNKSLQGMRCAVSGSGNVAQFAAQKLLEKGAKVVCMSDSSGVLVFDDGMTVEDWQAISVCKNEKRGRLSSLSDRGRYVAGESPWSLFELQFELGLPCATQNEIAETDAKRLVAFGIKGVIEGANLPTTMEAQDILRKADVLYIPGKASNAGGVGVSGFEMSQNAQRLTWDRDEVDKKLRDMMASIYKHMTEQHTERKLTLEQGANTAAFIKVANAMKELGWLY